MPVTEEQSKHIGTGVGAAGEEGDCSLKEVRVEEGAWRELEPK